METKEFTNDFSQGMTNTPSDSVCQDDSVAVEWNMIFRNGEHQPIQAPIDAFEGQAKDSRELNQLLYIHNNNNIKRCIFYNAKDKRLMWSFYDDIDTPTTLFDSFIIEKDEINGITSIGNTLIISLSTDGHKSLYYFLWKPENPIQNSKYQFIGSKLPNPNFDFLLHRNFMKKEGDRNVDYLTTKLEVNDNFEFNYIGGNYQTWEIRPKTGKEEDMKTFLIGAYSKLKVEAAQKNKFCLPFFIRYALKLYDGSYTNISTPILMLPSFRRNVGFSNHDSLLECIIYPCTLLFKQTIDLTQWKDIIKGITIFITKPIEVNDTQVIGENKTPPDGISTNELPDESSHDNLYGFVSERPLSGHVSYTGSYSGYNSITSFASLTKEQMEMALENESVFYKLFDIDLKSMDLYSTIDRYLRPHDLENITTAEQLDHDDYYSNCEIYSDNMFMYNKRLHLSNPSRGFFKGSTLFCPYTLNDGAGIKENYISYVYIKTQSGERIVKKEFATQDYLKLFYYYPDPRAYKVDIFVARIDNLFKRYSVDLKKHPLLNGAYYIDYDIKEVITDTAITPPKETSNPELLENEIWVSEANNPFVFNALGVNTVGNGSIIGITSNTTALSQGQFGQFPLICFTTDGIWALQTSSEGIYSSAHPISREVCNNKNSIVATDHLIFFSSEKGLMMINGSQVSCVSSMLSGKTFYPTPKESEVMESYDMSLLTSLNDFLKEAMMAYDYRDNLLWIVNPNHKMCYILSIDSGAYAITTLPYQPVAIVNDFPDNIIEMKTDKTEEFSGIEYNTYESYSLINRPNINDDERRIDGFIFSRPMKFGNPVGLKNLSELRLIERLNEKAGYRLRVFVSDDLKNWTKTNSLRGRGFKYYKLNLIFENMLPTDSVSAIIGRVQTRYQTKFR